MLYIIDIPEHACTAIECEVRKYGKEENEDEQMQYVEITELIYFVKTYPWHEEIVSQSPLKGYNSNRLRGLHCCTHSSNVSLAFTL